MPPRASTTDGRHRGRVHRGRSCPAVRRNFQHVHESVTTIASNLQQARTGASATTLIDGRVLVVGGSNGSGDLATAEIFEPVGQTFTLVDTTLSVPRSGHTATLLPHNNGVLVSGGYTTVVSDGTATSVSVTTTDVFVPAIFTDPYTWGMGSFIQSDEMQQPRSRAVGGPAGDAGYAFAAGGGPNDAEAYRYATIATDKDDYAPGQQAIITGSGWQPLEEVTLLFQEDPAVHPDYTLTVTANANGDIYWDQWAPEEHDLSVRFYLTAQDSRSRAQTTFTDGNVSAATIQIRNNTCTTAQSSFTTGSTVCAHVVATIQGGGTTAWRIQWYAPGVVPSTGTPARDIGFTEPAGTTTSTRDDSFAVTTAGTWTVVVCKTANPGSCSSGNQVDYGDVYSNGQYRAYRHLSDGYHYGRH